MKSELGLLVLLLSALTSMVGASYAVTQELEIAECASACAEFIPKLDRFFDLQVPRQELTDIIELSWTTCQYKCRRCAFETGVRSMNTLRSLFYNNLPSPGRPLPYSFVYINPFQITIKLEATSCVNNWNLALSRNDNTTSF